jgi:hypothetical protein
VDGRGREEGQRSEYLRHHQCHLRVVVGRQVVDVDDVDISLRELAESSLLRSLTAPHLLHLVAPQGEVQA